MVQALKSDLRKLMCRVAEAMLEKGKEHKKIGKKLDYRHFIEAAESKRPTASELVNVCMKHAHNDEECQILTSIATNYINRMMNQLTGGLELKMAIIKFEKFLVELKAEAK